ncbi:hypothetical protein B0H17DRAFT_1032668 [Mycena rosella]|uniref:Secreted protein n=1 Tax=Mycena rosella TaxID=1033263 RepID=A0AAD7GH97_MYCRO|nr:hypothetical protein B0H17DRAFT_1067331 [Mycena rosella]KAJ7707429.1 hypothetical protein B0H17DRAFT_1032668 [Mycena rosella]
MTCDFGYKSHLFFVLATSILAVGLALARHFSTVSPGHPYVHPLNYLAYPKSFRARLGTVCICSSSQAFQAHFVALGSPAGYRSSLQYAIVAS